MNEKPITDQMLVDKAVKLDTECKLCLSSKQQDWLEDLIYDDEGEPVKNPQLSPKSHAFLLNIYTDFYTEK